MNIIICADDDLGTFFNERRQSRDQVLQDHILKICSGQRLLMSPYSAAIFNCAANPNIIVCEDFLFRAKEDDYCFVEGIQLAEAEPRIQKIILCRWNRLYPSDQKLDIPLAKHGWNLISAEDLAGKSHQKITLEVYSR